MSSAATGAGRSAHAYHAVALDADGNRIEAVYLNTTQIYSRVFFSTSVLPVGTASVKIGMIINPRHCDDLYELAREFYAARGTPLGQGVGNE